MTDRDILEVAALTARLPRVEAWQRIWLLATERGVQNWDLPLFRNCAWAARGADAELRRVYRDWQKAQRRAVP